MDAIPYETIYDIKDRAYQKRVRWLEIVKSKDMYKTYRAFKNLHREKLDTYDLPCPEPVTPRLMFGQASRKWEDEAHTFRVNLRAWHAWIKDNFEAESSPAGSASSS